MRLGQTVQDDALDMKRVVLVGDVRLAGKVRGCHYLETGAVGARFGAEAGALVEESGVKILGAVTEPGRSVWGSVARPAAAGSEGK